MTSEGVMAAEAPRLAWPGVGESHTNYTPELALSTKAVYAGACPPTAVLNPALLIHQGAPVVPGVST